MSAMEEPVKRGQCPRCRLRIPMSKGIFASDFRCGRCAVPLFVSGTYGRALGALSVLLGWLLVWALGIRAFVPFCFFALLAPFAVLFVTVRVWPYVLCPMFVLLKPGTITTIRLGDGPGRERF
jgi:hypothetical protein